MCGEHVGTAARTEGEGRQRVAAAVRLEQQHVRPACRHRADHDLGLRCGRRQRLLRHLGREVAAASIAETVELAVVKRLDVADQDGVVAAVDDLVHGAVEPRRDAVEDRRAVRSGLPGDGGEAVLDRPGEGVGDVFLVLRQDVGGKALHLRHRGEVAGAAGDSNQK